MNRTLLAIGVAATAVIASFAIAQPYGPGYGPGWGNGPGAGAGPGWAQGPASGQSPGPGYRQGPRSGYGRGDGPAAGTYTLLSPDERFAFRERMHNATTVDECKAVVAERRQLMDARAKEQAVTAPPGPNAWMCERMKERGMLD